MIFKPRFYKGGNAGVSFIRKVFIFKILPCGFQRLLSGLKAPIFFQTARSESFALLITFTKPATELCSSIILPTGLENRWAQSLMRFGVFRKQFYLRFGIRCSTI